MPLHIINGDLTTMDTDAIVNAANSALQMGGGVCGAIFKAAGAKQLQAACNEIGHCDIGQAVMTPGYLLRARYIIHTVGPVWRGGEHCEAERLADCYRNALQLAAKHKLSSIAFPLISAGIFRYPKEEAVHIATETIKTLLGRQDLTVYLVLFG